ncbi:putative negative regulator of RcsB-dependent stress response [Pedobacter sp. UYP30]|uniref:tetratricopeptide repeat protein n=1 Tax=Pedobacter sp. UYP30 TaxID=1756400 RepID=UPI003398683C
MKKVLLLIGISLLPIFCLANFDFNENCLEAYNSIFQLKLNNARAYLNTERKLRPNNAIIPLLENYIDYFSLLTTESKAQFEKLKNNKSSRLAKIGNDDKNSPYYLYAQAEINLQWALIRARYGEYFASALEIRKARAQLLENNQKFPDFVLNQKGLGLIDAVLGSLPEGTLKSALNTFGVKGNLKEGLNKLNRLASSLSGTDYRSFYPEVVFYYSYVLSDVAHSPAAFSKTISLCKNISDSSLLKAYLQSYVSVRSGHTDEAIQILKNRPTGPLYQPFAYLSYLEGVAYLNQLNLSAAQAEFTRFLQINKGVNYIKDTYLHLAWIELLNNNVEGYKVLAAKGISKGFTYQEKDKQAQKEAAYPAASAVLIKARLLFDGGYFDKALSTLNATTSSAFGTDKDRTEYYYRLGRVYEKLEKDNLALENYQNAVKFGANLSYYFAANAALQMGNIYQSKNNRPQAAKAYKMALDMKSHDYQNSIDSEAKAGLARVSG